MMAQTEAMWTVGNRGIPEDLPLSADQQDKDTEQKDTEAH